MPKGIKNKGFQMDRPSYTYHPEDDSPRGHEGDDEEGDRPRDSDRDDLRAHVDQDPYENQVYMEDRRQSNSPGWDFMKKMMPSQLEGAGRTLRFRGQTQFSDDQEHSQMAEPVDETHQPKTKAEVLDQLMKLREQPWPMQLRQEKKEELKSKLVTMGGKWYTVGPVVSVVESGTGKIKDLMDTLDPLHTLLKRIEGKHGASVAAVFNFIRDMIRLNIAIALLLLFGVVIPSSSLVEETDQALGWDVHGGNISNFTGDLCSALQIMSNSSLQECNNIYTNKVATDVELHSTDWLALVRDFLQGTGYLEWTLLFSGYYPVSLENSNFLIGLAYLLTVLVTYIISLVFVVRFVAKFLRNSTTTMAEDYGMTYSKIVFTGWDFTVQEAEASKIESMLFVSEVKAAFDDEEHTRRSLERTRNDNIKLYLKRLIINLIIMVLIGGSWAGIYFLVREAQKHTDGSAILEFIWEYAPTLTVAGLNLIFPMVFGFFVKLEQYKGRTELFLTLSRCVLVRLTSLGILVITKVGLIHNKERGCDPDDEFICWETHLGQQVYAVLILDAIIQIAMNLVVNVLRSSLKRINNPLCKTLGTIEFSVPGHVLDVVYIQAVCWIGLLYSPLIATACLLYFCLIFFLKLFTLSVTCVPSSRVFRASRSSAMFMTILALAFFMCLVPNAMALLYIEPSQACSPFRGLGYAWEVLTYYICNLSGSAYWIRSVLFTIDGTIVCVTVLVLVLLAAIYYFSLLGARGTMIKELEEKLKSANKDKNYLIEQMKQAQGVSAVG